jgi:Na+/proline symporter
MRLSTPDVVVLVLYFVAMIGVGIYVTRRASRNLDSYFLGGKSMPWWLLGISNASAMWTSRHDVVLFTSSTLME